MSTTSAPFGLRPVRHPSGTIRTEEMTIASGYAANIYENSPVKIVAGGTIEVAAAGDDAIGVFTGVRYVDSDGRPKFSNKWISGTTGTDIVCTVTRDPDIIYEIQANDSIDLTDIGEQMDWSAPGGSTTTGISSQTLDKSSTTTNAGLRVLGISKYPGNAAGDTYTICEVNISQHQERADVAAY